MLFDDDDFESVDVAEEIGFGLEGEAFGGGIGNAFEFDVEFVFFDLCADVSNAGGVGAFE